MQKTRKLILIGDSTFAEIAYEYFTHDSAYEVVAFSVEQAFVQSERLLGLPVVALETLENHYTPAEHSFFTAISYHQLNRLRTRLYSAVKAKGYAPASYISSRAFVWPNAAIGEHCFIMENNVIQPFVTLGDNCILWSGNHIGHHSHIKEHGFIASHAVISGQVTIGSSCFIGVNATIIDKVNIGEDCVIGAGALVTTDMPADAVVKGMGSLASGSARRLHRVT